MELTSSAMLLRRNRHMRRIYKSRRAASKGWHVPPKSEKMRAEQALRAAAPGLYEALKKLACLGNGDRPGNSVGNQIAQAALAKAEGTT